MSHDDEHDPLLGTVFADRYLVNSRLGKGGMAVVYKATDRNLGRDVAIKVLRKDVAADPVAAKRLVREARAAASLHHPNIITMHDVGERDGTVYVVMEVLTGQPLADVLENEGAIGVERAMGICEQLCSALATAHSQGIVHRDIKPENLFLIDQGIGDFVKVLDFSIAKLPTEMVTAALTRAGSVFGTPHYMAPEQVEGKSVGPQADLYAVGAVLYELITGDPPFDGPSVIDILLKHVKSPPPTLAARGIKAHPGLDPLIARLLAKKPGDRPASASLVRDELAKMLNDLRHEPESSGQAEVISPSAVHQIPDFDALGGATSADARSPAAPAPPSAPPPRFGIPGLTDGGPKAHPEPAAGPPSGPPPGAPVPTFAPPTSPPPSAVVSAPLPAVPHPAPQPEEATVAVVSLREKLDEQRPTVLDMESPVAVEAPENVPLDLPDALPDAPPQDPIGELTPGGAKRKFIAFGEDDPSEQRTLVGVGVGKAVAEMAARRLSAGVPAVASPAADGGAPAALPPAAPPPAAPLGAPPPPPAMAPPPGKRAPVPNQPIEAPGAFNRAATVPVSSIGGATGRPNAPHRAPSGPTAAHTRRPPARHVAADDRAPTQPGMGVEPVPPREAPGAAPYPALAATVVAQVPVATVPTLPVPAKPPALADGKSSRSMWIVVGFAAATAIAVALWLLLKS